LPGEASGPALSGRALRCWMSRYRRIWRASIWSSVAGPVFYLGAIGLGLGSLVNRHGTARLGGVSYLDFVAPAILAATAMTTGMTEASYPVFGSLKWNKIYLAAQATPLRPGDIFRGHLLFMTFRVAVSAAVFTAVMAAFGTARSGWAALALPAAVLTGLAFAAPVAAWAVTIRQEPSLTYLFRFGVAPLMLFSGTFFPLSQLPGWLRALAYATPLWHGVALCRAFSLGQVDAGSALIHAGYLAALAAAGVALGGRAYRRRLYV
jgi:lipooligosaccharide transport system permease protein